MDRDSAEPDVSTIPGDAARKWVDHHHRFAAPSTYVYGFVWDHTEPAAGPFCTDIDGNVLMDFTAHVGSMPLGYNNPKILDPLAEFDLVDPLKIAGQDFYVTGGGLDPDVPGPTGLMERLVEATSHYGMDTVFLSNTGGEAVENALKVAFDHTRGKYVLTCEGAFHGRTLGTLSLNRSKEVYRRYFPEISSVETTPFCTDRTCTPPTCECGFFFDDTSWLREMLAEETGWVNDEEVAALVIEPIQGEGGYRFPSDSFAAEVGALCREHDLTLVVDEVQCGVGRTGEMWASDHYAFVPDVIASAKALRVGATVSRAEVFPEETSRISSTWGAGDILGAAQGALTLDAIEEYDLLENATERGQAMKELLRDADLPGVTDVRGKGLMLAVEFESTECREDVIAAALSKGLLTVGCGHRTVRLLPPLDVTEREIELGADLFAGAVESVA
jgi:4-aminobutyrate aminotransferase